MTQPSIPSSFVSWWNLIHTRLRSVKDEDLDRSSLTGLLLLSRPLRIETTSLPRSVSNFSLAFRKDNGRSSLSVERFTPFIGAKLYNGVGKRYPHIQSSPTDPKTTTLKVLVEALSLAKNRICTWLVPFAVA